MFYLIYRITNKIDGKIYIGSHKTKNKDDGYMGSGKYLNYAIKKHSLENFIKEILFEYDNPTAMYDKEAEIVNEDFLASTNTYNLKKGGFGGWDYINKENKNIYGSNGQNGKKNFLSGDKIKVHLKENGKWEDRCKKISKTSKQNYDEGRIPPFLNKIHTEEVKLNHSINRKGIHGIGEQNSQYGTIWITNGTINKKIKKDVPIAEGWNKGRK